jgi:dCMP deaminase
MTKEQIYMDIAKLISKRSKCSRSKVGSIIVKDDHIISTGYNGTPTSNQNCCDVFKDRPSSEHFEWSKIHEIHAEQNAILWASINSFSIEGADIYTTMRPCIQCTKLIIGAKLKRIYYSIDYRKELHLNTIQEKFLSDNGVELIHIP